jgi:hypothetical protein
MFRGGEFQKFQEFVSGLTDGTSWVVVKRHGFAWSITPGFDKIEFVRKTKTQVVLLVNKVERRYRLADGRMVGASGYETFPLPSTTEEIENAESVFRVNLCKQEIGALVQKLKNVTNEQALIRVKEAIEQAVALAE